MKTVLVEVSKGIPEVIRCPKDTEVEIIDLDLLREGDVEDIKDYWNKGLSRRAQQYIKHRHPRMFRRLAVGAVL
jgi:hypothetical protein